jgi:hypothetical protein
MKSFELNFRDNFIAGWYIDQTICDQIILDYRRLVSEGKENPIKTKEIGYKNIFFNDLDISLQSRYRDEVEKSLDLYKNLYIWCDKGQQPWYMACIPNVQRYDPGSFYQNWHAENNGSASSFHRHLVFMTYLNDIFEGGETEFFYQQIKIRPKKGLTLIWPAGWTHVHKGLPAPREEKFIISGWFSYDVFSWISSIDLTQPKR